jgi:hypothetical protein
MWQRALRRTLGFAPPLVVLALAAVSAPAALAQRVVAGEVISADGGPVEGLQVRIAARALLDSVSVDASGQFGYTLPDHFAGETLELLIDARRGQERRYHPALIRLDRRDRHRPQGVILIPQRWTLASGRYAGTAVEISLERAFLPTCARCASFFRHHTAASGTGAAYVPTWSEHSFPLRVAFDRARSDQLVTARDSLVFWNVARELEEVFGRPLFRAAAYEETRPVDDEGPNDVVLVWIVSSLRNPGRGSVGYYGPEIITGMLSLRSTALLADRDGPSLVIHELLHALGFGHTCGWRSVLADTTRCPGQRSPLPTPEDVAYIELAHRVSELARESGARWGMYAALAGELADRGMLAHRPGD